MSADKIPLPLLTVRNLKVYLRVHERTVKAVDGVDIEVRAGQCVGIVGESGSGKSTLGRAITRLMPNIEVAELSGSVEFCGEDVLAMSPNKLRALRRHRGFSMVFQDPLSYLNPTQKIQNQLAEALRHLPNRQLVRDRSEELLLDVGLTDAARVLRLYPHQLSGGMRQRVMIAMALSQEPQLLVADEPTTALDATVQYQVIKTLRRLTEDYGLATLIITHDLGIIAELCDQVYVMFGGKIVEAADVFSLFETPKNEYTASLLAAARRLHQTEVLGECTGVGA
jgi:ABC-type dipeptide/oligopeptide/nickel transport system ATPase component